MLKTIFVFIYVGLVMIFLIPLSIIPMILYFIGFRKSMTALLPWIAQVWAFSLIKMTGARVTVSGEENIIKNSGMCFVSNHCGYFDIVVMLAYCKRQLGFVAKKELLYIPFLNFWIHMLGGLFIDRKNVRKALPTIEKGVRRIKSGGCMVIYPEGHRSKGRGLLPFHPGSLKLATKAEAPIIPVAIEGSYEIFEKTFKVKSADIKIAFLEPIMTSEIPVEDRKLVLCEKIYEAIKSELEKK